MVRPILRIWVGLVSRASFTGLQACTILAAMNAVLLSLKRNASQVEVPYMGKKEFHLIYQAAVWALNGRPKIKLSEYSHPYKSESNYARIIIYHTYGSFQWQERAGQGLAAGYLGRAFYVIILCTDNWPAHALKEAGQGRVHDYLYRQYLNLEWSEGWTCCGGFAILKGESRYSSVWLNRQSGRVGQLSWESDGSKMLSNAEEELVKVAITTWRQQDSGTVVDVPDDLHNTCMSVQAHVPSQAVVPVHLQGVYAVQLAQGPLRCGYAGQVQCQQNQVNQGCECTIM